jgi:EAL domain-containing protein (putative c-di-GMP-specific phosphodiesterase class I)
MYTTSPSIIPRDHHKGRVVYILDDDQEVCALMARILEFAGFSTRQFNRVEDFELALTLEMPVIIILDLSLGQSDAVEVMRGLAGKRFSGAILLMSGRHDAKTIEQVQTIGQQYGFVMLPFLRKPFLVAEVKASLAAIGAAKPRSTNGSDLESALQNNWLELWYQPKIDLRSNLVYGAEALIRLRHPERGILLPAAFLPSPNDPLHKPLADFIMQRALADWSYLAADRITMRIAVNMPVSVFEDVNFVSSVRKYLPTHPKFPGLIVELTEDEVIRNPDLVREIATQLKLYNIDLAIGDFGRGISDLERLKQLPFTELKIDRKHVQGCASNPQQYELCQCFVTLAHQHNMTAVAEGVESVDDLQALVKMQCDGAQGFILAEPMERRHFVKTLLSRVEKRRPEASAGAITRR